MPFGSYAHKLSGGIPSARCPASDFAFHGRRYSPITTSSGSVPSGLGLDHFQQNPAVSRPVNPFSTFARTDSSNSSGDEQILNSKSSARFQSTFAVRSIPSVLFTQFMKPSDPEHRNWASSRYSKTLQPRE